MVKWNFVIGLLVVLALPAPALAQTAGADLAPTPPMGWNSWNHFGGKVDAADVRAAADALVTSGLKADGYIYVNIDDTWQGKRDAKGFIHPNRRFPDMKALADYVHARGLKLGIYSSPGPKTCAGYAGSYGHEKQDAETYAKWGIDYLKYDLCSFIPVMRKAAPHDPQKQLAMMKAAYAKMHAALVATGRPIVFSICQYGWDQVWTWGASVGGNLWRTTGDIRDTYARMSAIGFNQLGLYRYAGPGHVNDPDMLEVGNGGMTYDEYQTHMSLWAILAAPLLAGNDLSHMSKETRTILGNREVIAVDQDPRVQQGHRWTAKGDTEIWIKPLVHGALAAGLFNRDTRAHRIRFRLAALGFGATARLRDLWRHRVVHAVNGVYSVIVPPHGVVLLKISP